MSELPKILRPPKSNDLKFIYNSWLRSFKESPDNAIKGDGPYYSYQKMLIVSILDRSYISILCNPDDIDQIYGYAVYELTEDQIILHWIQVKYLWKRLGFATFIMNSIRELAESKGIFNPIITITARGLSYKHVKDQFTHIYLPKLAFKIKEL